MRTPTPCAVNSVGRRAGGCPIESTAGKRERARGCGGVRAWGWVTLSEPFREGSNPIVEIRMYTKEGEEGPGCGDHFFYGRRPDMVSMYCVWRCLYVVGALEGCSNFILFCRRNTFENSIMPPRRDTKRDAVVLRPTNNAGVRRNRRGVRAIAGINVRNKVSNHSRCCRGPPPRKPPPLPPARHF